MPICTPDRWLRVRHSVRVSDDDARRIADLLAEASALLGPGHVLLQIWSSPVVEWVYVGIEDDRVVVSDNCEAFGWITGHRLPKQDYLPWSVEKATTAADRFGVEVLDESEEGSQAFRLAHVLQAGESLADVVQSVALAIDGTLALHAPPGSPTGYFWNYDDGH